MSERALARQDGREQGENFAASRSSACCRPACTAPSSPPVRNVWCRCGMFSTVTASPSGLQTVACLAPPRSGCERLHRCFRPGASHRAHAQKRIPQRRAAELLFPLAVHPTFSGASGSGMRVRQSVSRQPSASPPPHVPGAPGRRSRQAGASRPPENSFPHAGLQRFPAGRCVPRNRPPPCGPRRPTRASAAAGSGNATGTRPGANKRAVCHRPSRGSRHSSLCADAANPTAPSQRCADPTR